ncbi:MAG: hypothetical protein ACRC6N_04835, partial [Plesiomonas sp.]|uniref:hypothetical protein n=1 Tax=Plesiomonas sp. TaxID=2486279 RepID=UPI003F2C93EC
TSKMAWQNRAEKGGVCVMFGEDCCTYIPNNTAPDGSFTHAMEKLKNLRDEITANAGRDKALGTWFESMFGFWGKWLTKMGITIVVVLMISAILFCCVFPTLRSLLVKATARQMLLHTELNVQHDSEALISTMITAMDKCEEYDTP